MLTRRKPLARAAAPKRRAKLEGGGRLPARRSTPRRSSRIEAPHYLAWLRLQRCGVAIAFPEEAARCSGPIDPEHKREGVGMGQRASDADAWACCRLHHDERHDGRGPFAAMDRATLRQFVRCQIDGLRREQRGLA